MKTAISLFFILTTGVSNLAGIHLKCQAKDAEEWKARWDHKQCVDDDGFVYVYVQGQVLCPDGSGPNGVVELWERD
ncbi:hypothetical protein AAVH_23836 [Aphelenchoides avenae]|nr:hypothetical protein AAVH_23836 [Aphelenchus avenae]